MESIPKIDFVITWVDGDDPQWLAEKHRALLNAKMIATPQNTDYTDLRFRNDFDFLKYWFRGVEKFAPWVNQIFFVTYGHLPEWLNLAHPQLKIIRHRDFIPQKYLPTFNSHTIEHHLHRIKGLSEYFVYFNDDFYLLKKTKPKDFFVETSKAVLPRAFFAENILTSHPSRDIFPYIQMNNMALINRLFDKRTFYKQHLKKAYHPKNGLFNLRSLLLSPWRDFSLLYDPHCATAYLKSTFRTVWQQATTELDQTCLRPFRSDRDLSHLIFYYSQLLTGNFVPRSANFTHHTMLSKDQQVNQSILQQIRTQKYHILCINDGPVQHPQQTRREFDLAFQSILPDKSLFEQPSI